MIIVIRREEIVTEEGLVLIAFLCLSNTILFFRFLSHILHALLTASLGTRSFCNYKLLRKRQGKLWSQEQLWRARFLLIPDQRGKERKTKESMVVFVCHGPPFIIILQQTACTHKFRVPDSSSAM